MKKLANAIGVSEGENLSTALSKLPQLQQEILEQYYSMKISVREIAQNLECSVTSVYSLINKSIFYLRRELNPKLLESSYRILYPQIGKRPTIASSTSSAHAPENIQSDF